MITKKNSYMMKLVVIVLAIAMLGSFVSAGVGIKWDRESALSNEGEDACLTYGIYNPWPEDTYVEVGVSEELEEVLTVQDVEATLIPSQTSSGESIPVEFCFNVPEKIYEKECWLGDSFVCKQECKENQKIYEGDVEVRSVPPPIGGGSSAIMVVSAPLRVKVRCVPHGWDYTLLYVIIGVIAVIGLIWVIRHRKPKEQRIREEMAELKKKLKKVKK